VPVSNFVGTAYTIKYPTPQRIQELENFPKSSEYFDHCHLHWWKILSGTDLLNRE
jgi:hypothetical protein